MMCFFSAHNAMPGFGTCLPPDWPRTLCQQQNFCPTGQQQAHERLYHYVVGWISDPKQIRLSIVADRVFIALGTSTPQRKDFQSTFWGLRVLLTV
jgi:hypothetical protein